MPRTFMVSIMYTVRNAATERHSPLKLPYTPIYIYNISIFLLPAFEQFQEVRFCLNSYHCLVKTMIHLLIDHLLNVV